MKYKFLLALLIFVAGLLAFKPQQKNILYFKTSTGHVVKVAQGRIFYDKKQIFQRQYDDDILYDNKSNRLLEDHGTTFLFLAIDGRPNLDLFNVYSITSAKAALVAEAMLSPIKDYDGDGYLEFGGRDLTEMYPNTDSMYYIPTDYYEIRNGKIHPDNALTRREDIKINGLYLPPDKQPDKDGFCCKVIPTPIGKRPKKPVIPPHYIADGRPFMSYDTITIFAAKSILENKTDINYVIHNNQGKWFFYSDKAHQVPVSSLKKVPLATIINIDQSILLLSNLANGWYAERTAKTAPWGFNIW